MISVRDLLDAGAHFGHQTHRWNPKMKPYIYGARNGIYIINLETTQKQWLQARHQINQVIGKGEKILFVGTKPQAQQIIEEEATRGKQHFVNVRWLGGMLTNFQTIKSRIDRLDEIQKIKAEQTNRYTKKELSDFDKEYEKLEKTLKGIRDMKGLPGLIFVVDPKKEHIAISEARKLQIPVIAITDTNCDPDGVDFVIPSNDDALKAIRLFLSDAAEACLEGEKQFEEMIQQQTRERQKAQKEKADSAAAATAAAAPAVAETASIPNA